jgi:hypothetical protein
MSGCDADRLEALLIDGVIDGEDGDGTGETRAHVAACASCAEELAWLRAERQLFTARAAHEGADLPAFMPSSPSSPSGPALPPFTAILAEVRRERRSRWVARAPWLGLAAAAALALFFTATRAPAPVAVAEPAADFTCYDDPRSLAVEATAYATDRAVASAEDQYGACLMATPAVTIGSARERSVNLGAASGSCVFPVEADVTCRSLWPLDDEIFASGICGGSLQ